MGKIDFDRFICYLLGKGKLSSKHLFGLIEDALGEQGLECRHGKIKEKSVTVIPTKVDFDLWKDDNGKWKGSITIGEEYYETDPYKDKYCALAELKGWWEGVKVQVESGFKCNEEEL